MIISHTHRLIFIKPQKVAGTSFEIALSRFLSERDVVTPITPADESIRASLGFAGPRNYLMPERKPGGAKMGRPGLHKRNNHHSEDGKITQFYNHCTAAEIRENVDPPVWNDYRKISFVRNPWDRAVSLYCFRMKEPGQPVDFGKFGAFFEKRKNALTHNHPLYFVGDKEIIDSYIRYENRKADILSLEAAFPALGGLWETFDSITTKGDYREKQVTVAEVFNANPAVDVMVRERNAWDISKFGYELPD